MLRRLHPDPDETRAPFLYPRKPMKKAA
jgi:hypothetical protein